MTPGGDKLARLSDELTTSLGFLFTVYAPLLLLLARQASGESAEAPASALLPPTGQDGFKDSVSFLRIVYLLVYLKVMHNQNKT